MLARALSMALALVAVGCQASVPVTELTTYTEQDVTYRNGDVQLAALLLVPDGRGPFPAAVILQGSGDSDRTNAWSRQWAVALATHGVAALLTDKRGSGKSGGDWKAAGFDVLARDAVAGVEFLRGIRNVRRNAVGVVGLSQGGHVAPLAGTLSPQVAFVVAVSGASTTAIDQVNHEMRNTFRQAGLDERGVEAGMRLQHLAANYVRSGEWDPYQQAIQQALASPLKPVAEGFPQTRDSWVWTWWRLIGEYDPLPYWKALKVPALVMYGALDEQDNVPVAESTRRLGEVTGTDLTVRVFPGAGHALFDPQATNRSLLPGAVELLVSWIHRRF